MCIHTCMHENVHACTLALHITTITRIHITSFAKTLCLLCFTKSLAVFETGFVPGRNNTHHDRHTTQHHNMNTQTLQQCNCIHTQSLHSTTITTTLQLYTHTHSHYTHQHHDRHTTHYRLHTAHYTLYILHTMWSCDATRSSRSPSAGAAITTTTKRRHGTCGRAAAAEEGPASTCA